jgi:hypothetical protein
MAKLAHARYYRAPATREVIVPPLRRSIALATFTLASAVGSAAHADTGIQVGARAGVQLLDDDELRHQNAFTVGAEARFSFELSPLLVGLTFDHFFVEDRTLFQIGANALYDLPLGLSFLYPYLGVGVAATGFELPETAGPPAMGGGDSNGTRLGMNLLGGVRFDHVALPVVRPFAQVMLSVGPIDVFTVVGGVLFELAGD